MSETEPALSTLTAELESPDPAVRWRLAAVLADVPGEESERLLVSLMADPDYRVREKSVAALRHRFTKEVAAACADALADDENAGRRAAGLSLLEQAGSPGRKVLLDALSHPSEDVRLAAAMALPGRRFEGDTMTSLEQAVRKEQDPNVRAALLLALGRTGRREAVATLLAVLEEGSHWLRVHALEALGEMGDPEIAPRLLPLLDQPLLRSAALRSLARLDTSAPLEELLRHATAGGCDAPLLAAVRRSVEMLPPEARVSAGKLWPQAEPVLQARLEDPEASAEEKGDAAHLLAALDLPGAAAAIVRCGPFADGHDALDSLSPARFQDALHAVLQAEDPEPSLALVVRARARGETEGLTPLLVHPSPVVRAAVLAAIPPAAASFTDLIDILAEEDPQTALPAAYALAAEEPGSPEGTRSRRGALLDRSRGPDGPGRVAALIALGELDIPGVDSAIRQALSSGDAEVRQAAASAAGGRHGLPEEELLPLLDDADVGVRAALLRAMARRAIRGEPLRTTWRDLLPHLADEPLAAAAAGAAVVALAGSERPRIVEEMLAQDEPIRRAALEAVPLTGDAEAASRVIAATVHEDTETARAALYALELSADGTAEDAFAQALEDERREIRLAAADVISRRPAPALPEGSVPRALAAALATERDPEVLEMLVGAVPAGGGPACIGPLTAVLAAERVGPAADSAALALAKRCPDEVRDAWASAPARAERRWARALSGALEKRAS